MLNVAVIGSGAMAMQVLELLRGHERLLVCSVVVSKNAFASEAKREMLRHVAPHAEILLSLDPESHLPDLLVECAGHTALMEHIVPALERGVNCIIASVGALSEDGAADALGHAALRGNSQVQLASGAVGAIDALAAARLGGLDAVSYTGRKPPEAWKGTPGEGLASRAVGAVKLFEGSARDAARMYPKNANVAATVSLAGLGLDATRVCLISDPDAGGNVHHVEVSGNFGSFEITLRARALAGNPKTSALAAFSVAQAVLAHVELVTT